MREEEHAFPKTLKSVSAVALPEGDWEVYRASHQWKAKQKANEISYMWDALIEHQSGLIRSGKQVMIGEYVASTSSKWAPAEQVPIFGPVIRFQ